MWKRVATVSTCALLVASTARAQNLREIPLGGTSAVMGGAANAAGNDSSMPYVNPAGVAANAGTDLLSISASLYGYAVLSVPQYFRPNGLDPALGDMKVDEEEFGVKQVRAIPTGLTYFGTLGSRTANVRHVVALSIHSPTYSDTAASGTFRADGSLARIRADENTGERVRMIYFGPSYAVAIGKRVRLGVSVFGYYSDLKVDDHRVSYIGIKGPSLEDPFALNRRVQIDGRSLGVAAAFGGQFNVAGGLWTGLAFETAGLPFWGDGDATEITTRSDYDEKTNAPVAAHSASKGTFKEFGLSRPWRVSFGLAYVHPRFTIAADLYAHLPTGPFERGVVEYQNLDLVAGQPPSATTATEQYRRAMRPTMNFSVGGQVNVSEKVRLSLGFLTDIDAREATSNGRPNDRLNYYGGTLGFGLKGDPFDSTYGFSYRYGRGKMYVYDGFGPTSDEVALEYDAHSFFIILSGTVEVGAGADLMAKLFHRNGSPVR